MNSLITLTDRKKKILEFVVKEYIETAEPVGSQTISKNKDLTFCISFQANRRNYACSVEFSVHFLIESKAMKKDNINNGFVYGGELETLINRGRGFRRFELAGASYQYSIDEGPPS